MMIKEIVKLSRDIKYIGSFGLMEIKPYSQLGHGIVFILFYFGKFGTSHFHISLSVGNFFLRMW